ncbi:MAG TPA: SWIM zinc finger family protein [Polyangiaceae bacterium]|nr:SWIM zinc finger family protein [Polyangiaceae bacterium]
MSPDNSGRFFPPATKKPPPDHGIKMKRAGTTWWGQRWLEALQTVLGAGSGRLARGRTYARAGRTHDLVVNGGKVSAKVTGSRAAPYAITLELAGLDAVAWQQAIAGMAAKAQFAAELLAGEMPKEIDEVFLQAGSSLFPRQRAELVTSCSCPDWGDPCKHVAATHFILGEALDRDPFLLFELRGRTKAQVLEALRLARIGEDASASVPWTEGGALRPTEGTAKPEVPSVELGMLDAADYDRAPEALPVLQFSFDEPVVPGALLRQLGAPAAWASDQSPAEALSPLVRRAAAAARRIAHAEPAAERVPSKRGVSRRTRR